MTRRERTSLAWGSVVIVILLVCTGPIGPAIDVAENLAFGWVSFIARVFPKVQVRWDLVIWAMIYVAAFLFGSHLFLRWLYREIGGGAWSWRWTFSGFVLVILMFLSGMASIGITHQVGWLATSPKPIIRVSFGEALLRKRCESNLREIGVAIEFYCKDNGGRFPDDFGVLLRTDYLAEGNLICPDVEEDERYEGNTVRTAVPAAPGVSEPSRWSYTYFGKGLTAPVANDRVIASEPVANHHGNGANVLFGDGHVEFVLPSQLLKLLPSASALPTRP